MSGNSATSERIQLEHKLISMLTNGNFTIDDLRVIDRMFFLLSYTEETITAITRITKAIDEYVTVSEQNSLERS